MSNDNISISLSEALEQMRDKILACNRAPILFCGSGLSRRYYNAPDWKGLLEKIEIEVQANYPGDKTDLENWATELEYFAFKKEAPNYSLNETRRDPLRKIIARIVSNNSNKILDDKQSELNTFSQITPAAIITTNYDTFLEHTVFPNKLETIVGDDIIPSQTSLDSLKLYKIHGCVKKPSTIVITKEDYDIFMSRAKYFYAKLMTYFFEYPIVFIGYGIGDRNVKSVLETMVEVMNDAQLTELQERIWIIGYCDGSSEQVKKSDIKLDNSRSLSVTELCIDESYGKTFECLAQATSEVLKTEYSFTISNNAIDLFIKPLYTIQNKLTVVVRELLQNAIDACRKINANTQVSISVCFNNSSSYLTIRDYGIGMNSYDINNYLLVVGESSKNDSTNLIGSFGIGILSVFLLANEVKIISKKNNESVVGILINSDKKIKSVSSPEFIDKTEYSGTEVTVFFDASSLDHNTKHIINSFLQAKSSVTKSKPNIETHLRDLLGLKHLLLWNSDDSIKVNVTVQNINNALFSKDFEIDTITEQKEFQNVNSYLHVYNGYSSEKFNSNKALINGLITDTEYDINFDNGMCKTMPFVVIDTDSHDIRKCIVPDLSRKKVKISGELAKSIKDWSYNNEAIHLIKSVKYAVNNNKYFYKFALNGCRLITPEMVYYKGRQLFISSTNSEQVICITNNVNRIIDHISSLNHDEEVKFTYIQQPLNRTSIADMIESIGFSYGAIAIGVDYIYSYLIKAYDSHNGFRKDAVEILLNFLDVDNINYDNASTMWATISSNREIIKNKLDTHIYNKYGLLWFDTDNPLYHAISSDNLEKYKDTVIQSIPHYHMDSLMISKISAHIRNNPWLDDYIKII